MSLSVRFGSTYNCYNCIRLFKLLRLYSASPLYLHLGSFFQHLRVYVHVSLLWLPYPGFTRCFLKLLLVAWVGLKLTIWVIHACVPGVIQPSIQHLGRHWQCREVQSVSHVRTHVVYIPRLSIKRTLREPDCANSDQKLQSLRETSDLREHCR